MIIPSQPDLTQEVNIQPLASQSHLIQPKFKAQSRIDWGEAIDVSIFYGRAEELAQTNQWVIQDRCRLVAILGMGGIGKTALSVKLAEQIQDQFEYLIWRSLRNAPPIQDLLAQLIQFLSNQQEIEAKLPKNLDGRVFATDGLFTLLTLFAVCSVAFSPDGQTLASGSDDQTVRVWDLSTAQCCQTFQGHTTWVCSVAFSPANATASGEIEQMASGSHDQTLKLWDLSTGQCRRTLRGCLGSSKEHQ